MPKLISSLWDSTVSIAEIECWFSILMKRLLKRSSFTSTQDLSDRILAFIEYFNRSLAEPFEWKYKGYPDAL
ncbi:hypothetical protein [Coleofasciculus sp. G1-WW12-02]|uniref:hypothetical protein n=1 Tax=Coleofasciculus sp. G1-WW12-02 TaxID=3068483 RepID=UPI004063DEC4